MQASATWSSVLVLASGVIERTVMTVGWSGAA